VQAVGLSVAFVGHARDRWPKVFRLRPARLPGPVTRHRPLVAIAAAVVAGYAALLAVSSLSPPGWGGPAGFESVAQRAALLATGVLVLSGAVAVPVLLWWRGSWPVVGPLVLAWVGTGVTVTAGPTHIALSNHGDVSVLLVSASLVATLAGLLLARFALDAFARHPPDGSRSEPGDGRHSRLSNPNTHESDTSPFTTQSSRNVPSRTKPTFSRTLADATLRVSASA